MPPSRRFGDRSPQLANPTKTAKPLVNRFFVLVQNRDRDGLRRFLSPGFQIQRADGSGAGKRQYLEPGDDQQVRDHEAEGDTGRRSARRPVTSQRSMAS
jgi:hypothetical protein